MPCPPRAIARVPSASTDPGLNLLLTKSRARVRPLRARAALCYEITRRIASHLRPARLLDAPSRPRRSSKGIVPSIPSNGSSERARRDARPRAPRRAADAPYFCASARGSARPTPAPERRATPRRALTRGGCPRARSSTGPDTRNWWLTSLRARDGRERRTRERTTSIYGARAYPFVPARMTRMTSMASSYASCATASLAPNRASRSPRLGGALALQSTNIDPGSSARL